MKEFVGFIGSVVVGTLIAKSVCAIAAGVAHCVAEAAAKHQQPVAPAPVAMAPAPIAMAPAPAPVPVVTVAAPAAAPAPATIQ